LVSAPIARSVRKVVAIYDQLDADGPQSSGIRGARDADL